MKVVVAFASIALVQANILYTPDFYHYKNQSTVVEEESCNGVVVDRWDAMGQEKPHLSTLNPEKLQRITLPQDGTYPAKNGGTPYWLLTEAVYVVAIGAANFRFANGTVVKLLSGDMFYAPGGTIHGPIKNAVQGETVVMALADLTPQSKDVTIQPALLPTNAIVGQIAFQPRGGEYGTAPPDLPDCITIATANSLSGILQATAVHMKPECTSPFHFYATGAFYFFTQGTLRVSNDLPNPVDFSPGTARWARPGWAYGPEVSLKEEVYFLVLGLPPTLHYADPKATEFVVAVDLPNPAQVPYKNTQFDQPRGDIPPPRGDPAPEVQLRQKRVRRHLRSGMTEQEESVFLQQPMQHALDEEL